MAKKDDERDDNDNCGYCRWRSVYILFLIPASVSSASHKIDQTQSIINRLLCETFDKLKVDCKVCLRLPTALWPSYSKLLFLFMLLVIKVEVKGN